MVLINVEDNKKTFRELLKNNKTSQQRQFEFIEMNFKRRKSERRLSLKRNQVAFINYKGHKIVSRITRSRSTNALIKV
jgi:hypothetical protein